MLVPGVAASVGRAGRPLTRAALRTGAVGAEEFRKAAAEAYEHMEDMMAEVREEMQAERTGADAAADEAAASAEGTYAAATGAEGEADTASTTGSSRADAG